MGKMKNKTNIDHYFLGIVRTLDFLPVKGKQIDHLQTQKGCSPACSLAGAFTGDACAVFFLRLGFMKPEEMCVFFIDQAGEAPHEC